MNEPLTDLNSAAKACAEDIFDAQAVADPTNEYPNRQNKAAAKVILRHFTAFSEAMEKRVKPYKSSTFEHMSKRIATCKHDGTVYYSEDSDNFYCSLCNLGMGNDFHHKVKPFVDQEKKLHTERDQLAGQLSEYKLVAERIGNALEGVMGWYGAVCECGHPACKKCRDTADAKGALAAFYKAVGREDSLTSLRAQLAKGGGE